MLETEKLYYPVFVKITRILGFDGIGTVAFLCDYNIFFHFYEV